MKIVTDVRILAAPLAMVLLVTGVLADDTPLVPAESDRLIAARQDRLDLDTTSVKGNQELPKVLYIVPWQEAEAGDLSGKPVNSLLDEVLAPIDRDVFKRQLRYFDQLHVADRAAEQAVTDSK